jgi:hypothetical protein
MIRERASMLRYTYIACLVKIHFVYFVTFTAPGRVLPEFKPTVSKITSEQLMFIGLLSLMVNRLIISLVCLCAIAG